MKKTNENLILLNALFVTSLLIANIVASKVIVVFGLTLPSAIVSYPLTFLMSDIIGEIWGKKEANKTVKIGIICQAVSLLMIGLAILLPVAQFSNNQAEFEMILGNSFRVVLASMVAYICSQTWDVWIFHKIRNIFVVKNGNNKNRWIWNNASTMTSQIIDTAIFITIAFWGVVPNIFVMVLSQYIIKFIYALLDTPFFYILTRNRKGLNDEKI